jgi:hypothetical protein
MIGTMIAARRNQPGAIPVGGPGAAMSQDERRQIITRDCLARGAPISTLRSRTAAGEGQSVSADESKYAR